MSLSDHSFEPRSDLYDDWPAARRKEIGRNWQNRQVGSDLVSTHGNRLVWHLHLRPGERFPFHRHDCDYFWTCLTSGVSRSYFQDGNVGETLYAAGDTRHFDIAAGTFFVHDLENIGDTDLVFVTVEFLRDGPAVR